jgi:hypothetical protein
MEGPDRHDPASTEIDLTKTEGYPTGRAELELTLPIVGLKMSGKARLSNPVMALTVGVVAAVVIMLGAVIGGNYSMYPVELAIIGGGDGDHVPGRSRLAGHPVGQAGKPLRGQRWRCQYGVPEGLQVEKHFRLPCTLTRVYGSRSLTPTPPPP